MNDKIRLATKKDIDHIQKYIKENWSKNHIFIKNKELFFWQHKYIDKKRLNFVIAINSHGELCGIIGFISSNFSKFNIGVWTAIWHVNKELCNNKNTGMKIFNYIVDRFKPTIISGTQLNKEVKNIYKFLGFKILNSDQYFLPGVNKSNIFFTKKKIKKNKNISSLQTLLCKNISGELSLINDLIFDKTISNYNYTDSYKDKKYLIHRYELHPKYKYLVLKIKINTEILCQLVVRKIIVNKKKILRIIDVFYLNYSINSNLYSSVITNFIIKNKYEYIDFVSAAESSKLAEKLGFYKKNEKDLIPNNFEPFIKKNIKSIIAYKLSNEKKYFFFKGDADSDRPNK